MTTGHEMMVNAALAHVRVREIDALGHPARLAPPVCVKPFVRRHRKDAVDAAAVAAAAMRSVPLRSTGQQARAMGFRPPDLFLRQRTQRIDARRGPRAEHGLVAARGPVPRGRLVAAVAVAVASAVTPRLVQETAQQYPERVRAGDEKTAGLGRAMRIEAGRAATTKRLQTVPRPHATGGKRRMGRA